MANEISIDEAYSSEPWWYDLRGLLILKFAYRGSLYSQVKFFANNIGSKHLEVAIGSGSLFHLILYYCKLTRKPLKQVDGFDYAQKMINGAKRRFKKESNIKLFLADAADTQLQSGTYNTINIANAIHCLPEIDKSLKEMNRLLLPNGTLAGNCLLYPKGNSMLDKISNKINDWGTKKGILQRPYTQVELRQLLQQAGFEVAYERVQGNCYDFIARKI